MRRTIVLIGLAGLMTAQEPSTFRVNTRLVEVDVVVRSGDRPVTGLTRALEDSRGTCAACPAARNWYGCPVVFRLSRRR